MWALWFLLAYGFFVYVVETQIERRQDARRKR